MRPKAVPPILSSFSVYPPSITAGVAQKVTWSFGYANQPYPDPACTVDHGVGAVYNGNPSSITLNDSTTFEITCANSAGKSKKTARINVVKIEAKFDVAEYQIVILSAKEATGLEDWLKLNGYKIPNDAQELLRPYIESGSKFFVAKVDPTKVKMVVDADMLALGGDVVGGPIAKGSFTLTRLHARYGKNDMKDDLRFREAKPVTGGREMWSKKGIEYGATPSTDNFFQARYAIRYWWTGPMKCKAPQRGVWGGPPDGAFHQTIAASRTAFAPRGKIELAGMINRDLWEIGYKKKAAPPKPTTPPTGTKTMGFAFFGGGAGSALLMIGIGLATGRRRRRQRRGSASEIPAIRRRGVVDPSQ